MLPDPDNQSGRRLMGLLGVLLSAAIVAGRLVALLRQDDPDDPTAKPPHRSARLTRPPPLPVPRPPASVTQPPIDHHHDRADHHDARRPAGGARPQPDRNR